MEERGGQEFGPLQSLRKRQSSSPTEQDSNSKTSNTIHSFIVPIHSSSPLNIQGRERKNRKGFIRPSLICNSPDVVGTSSEDLPASLALPDPDRLSLHGILPTEGAGVGSVLGDFDLLDHFPEARTVASPVLPDDADLLSALTLSSRVRQGRERDIGN